MDIYLDYLNMSCPEISLHKSVTKWKDIQRHLRQNGNLGIAKNLNDLFVFYLSSLLPNVLFIICIELGNLAESVLDYFEILLMAKLKGPVKKRKG